MRDLYAALTEVTDIINKAVQINDMMEQGATEQIEDSVDQPLQQNQDDEPDDFIQKNFDYQDLQNRTIALEQQIEESNIYANGGDITTMTESIEKNFKEKVGRNPHNDRKYTISEEQADKLGYYPDPNNNYHRDDRVKLKDHPTHPSRGQFITLPDGRKVYRLSERGMQDPNYSMWGARDNGDGDATLMYDNTFVLPEITVTPKNNYIDNTYDNINYYGYGGPVNTYDVGGFFSRIVNSAGNYIKRNIQHKRNIQQNQRRKPQQQRKKPQQTTNTGNTSESYNPLLTFLLTSAAVYAKNKMKQNQMPKKIVNVDPFGFGIMGETAKQTQKYYKEHPEELAKVAEQEYEVRRNKMSKAQKDKTPSYKDLQSNAVSAANNMIANGAGPQQTGIGYIDDMTNRDFINQAYLFPEKFTQDYSNWVYPTIPQNQGGIYDADKVKLARDRQNWMQNSFYTTTTGWQDRSRYMNPYNDQQLINDAYQSSSFPARLVAKVGSELVPAVKAPIQFITALAAGYAGGKALDKGIEWTTDYDSWSDMAQRAWGWHKDYADFSNPGMWIGGWRGSKFDPIKIRNQWYTRKLANEFNKNIENTNFNWDYENPVFNRTKVGDLEINNPELSYRQGNINMGNDFLNINKVRTTESEFQNPLFSEGRLWYGVPKNKAQLYGNTEVKTSRFNLTKANEASPKTDILVTNKQNTRPANNKSRPTKPIITKDGVTRTNQDVRRIPISEETLNQNNTTLYRLDPEYGYRKVSITPADDIYSFNPLVDKSGNLTQPVENIINQVKDRVGFGADPAELINRGYGRKTNLYEHTADVIKSAQQQPLPAGVTRQDLVTSALYHDLGKIIDPSRLHGYTSNYLVDLMGWETKPNIAKAISKHMEPQEFFNNSSNLSKGLHTADVGRGMPYDKLIEKYPYLKLEPNSFEPTTSGIRGIANDYSSPLNINTKELFTKLGTDNLVNKIVKGEELSKFEQIMLGDRYAENVTVPKELQETFNAQVTSRIPMEQAVEPMVPNGRKLRMADQIRESNKINYQNFQNELQNGKYVSVDQSIIDDVMGEKGFSGYYDANAKTVVVTKDGNAFRLNMHEFRHKYDDLFGLPKEQQEVLEQAYPEEWEIFIEDLPETDPIRTYKNMADERVTTNLDSRLKALPKRLWNESVELQNKLLDLLSDNHIIRAVRESNGYGRRYINWLEQKYNGKIPADRIKLFREAMKKVGVGAGIGIGVGAAAGSDQQ